LAAVSRHGGQGHPRHGLLHRRHRVLHPALGALRHRVEDSSGAHPQDHRSSQQCLLTELARNLAGDLAERVGRFAFSSAIVTRSSARASTRCSPRRLSRSSRPR
jgi:hypothetical protein